MSKNSFFIAIRILLISLICIAPSLYFMCHKTQFHVDEVWTYGLSNSTKGPYLYVWRTGIGDDSEPTRFSSEQTTLLDVEEKFFQQWHTGEEFKQYITVQNGEQFQYSTVVYNQSCDVHPPLYYFIIHTICSLFPNTFSKWYAFIPNLLFMFGSLFLLYLIVIRLGLSKIKAVLIPLFWSLSRAGISDMVFLRMYMMLTFITLLYLYYCTKLYDDQRKKYVFIIFLINLTGFLTQYYYYIFCFFSTAVFCLYFLYRRKIKFAIVYGCSVLCTVCLAILLFPAAINQIFRGAYTESASLQGKSIQGITAWIRIMLNDFVGSISNKYSFIYTSILFSVFVIMVILLMVKLLKHKIPFDDIPLFLRSIFYARSTLFWLVLLITALTGSLLGIVSPIMPLYQDRYYFNILPILAIYFVDIIICILSKMLYRVRRLDYRKLLISLVLIALIVSGNLFPRNNYIDYDNNSTALGKVIEGETCFLVMQQDLRIHVYPIYLQNAEQVYVSHDVSDTLYSEINHFPGDHAYILVQFSLSSSPQIAKIIENTDYQVSILDTNIETALGYKENDALLFVDYSKPK